MDITNKDLLKNCRYCPSYTTACQGGADDCLCFRCPRNLGQCMKVRYCRETESILDNLNGRDSLGDEVLEAQLRGILERKKPAD